MKALSALRQVFSLKKNEDGMWVTIPLGMTEA